MFDRFKSIDPFFAFLDSVEQGQAEEMVVVFLSDGSQRIYSIREKNEIQKPSLKLVERVDES